MPHQQTKRSARWVQKRNKFFAKHTPHTHTTGKAPLKLHRSPLFPGAPSRRLHSFTRDHGDARPAMSQRRLQNGNGNKKDDAPPPPSLPPPPSPPPSPSPPPPPYYCPTPIDIVLVLDDSGSILKSDSVEPMKEFAKAVAKGFALGPNEGRIAIITFESNATLQTEFSTNLNEINDAIDKLKGVGSTSISDGLEMAQLEFDRAARADAPRVVVVCSDGEQRYDTGDCFDVDPGLEGEALEEAEKAACREAAIAASTPLKAGGANVFSWGFAGISLKTLEGIASDQSKVGTRT